ELLGQTRDPRLKRADERACQRSRGAVPGPHLVPGSFDVLSPELQQRRLPEARPRGDDREPLAKRLVEAALERRPPDQPGRQYVCCRPAVLPAALPRFLHAAASSIRS